MPDFIGTYELAGEPPEKWKEELQDLASSSGIKIRSTSKVGRRLIVKIGVPKSAPVPASEVAGSFLVDAESVLSGSVESVHAQLVGASPVQFFLFGLDPVQVVLLFAGSVAASVGWWVSSWSVGENWLLDVFMIVSPVVLYSFVSVLWGRSGSNRESTRSAERERQAVQERALVRQMAGEEDPKMRARLELARIALRMRASNMRGDADRLWRRSVWAYRGAFVFFLLAIAGPGVAAALLLKSPSSDWHFMFGGLSLAAVPLAIGTALLRHDTKLRDHYQESARDVASLERYELALDYARIASADTYQETMQKVILQLLSSRTDYLPQSTSVSSPSIKDSGNNEGSQQVGVQKLIDVTVEATKDVVTSIVPKKGG